MGVCAIDAGRIPGLLNAAGAVAESFVLANCQTMTVCDTCVQTDRSGKACRVCVYLVAVEH